MFYPILKSVHPHISIGKGEKLVCLTWAIWIPPKAGALGNKMVIYYFKQFNKDMTWPKLYYIKAKSVKTSQPSFPPPISMFFRSWMASIRSWSSNHDYGTYYSRTGRQKTICHVLLHVVLERFFNMVLLQGCKSSRVKGIKICASLKQHVSASHPLLYNTLVSHENTTVREYFTLSNKQHVIFLVVASHSKFALEKYS